MNENQYFPEVGDTVDYCVAGMWLGPAKVDRVRISNQDCYSCIISPSKYENFMGRRQSFRKHDPDALDRERKERGY